MTFWDFSSPPPPHIRDNYASPTDPPAEGAGQILGVGPTFHRPPTRLALVLEV